MAEENAGFPDPERVSAAEDPQKANALVAELLQDPEETLPHPPDPEDDEIVQLPGGLEVNGDVIREVQVRELTGADEERLAKAGPSKSAFHFLNTLLECGVVRIGDEDKKNHPKLLKQMLVGDRDWLVFGIRRVTYGPKLEITAWMGCPFCEEASDIELNLFDEDDIPVKKLDNPADRVFTVDLRKGRKAEVRLLTGNDQIALGTVIDASIPEKDTFILHRVVSKITDADGTVHNVAASSSLVRDMGMADRRTIMKAVNERQPGPRYTEIKFTHPPCGKEVVLGITLADLFLA